jgi:hypothetical protein
MSTISSKIIESISFADYDEILKEKDISLHEKISLMELFYSEKRKHLIEDIQLNGNDLFDRIEESTYEKEKQIKEMCQSIDFSGKSVEESRALVNMKISELKEYIINSENVLYIESQKDVPVISVESGELITVDEYSFSVGSQYVLMMKNLINSILKNMFKSINKIIEFRRMRDIKFFELLEVIRGNLNEQTTKDEFEKLFQKEMNHFMRFLVVSKRVIQYQFPLISEEVDSQEQTGTLMKRAVAHPEPEFYKDYILFDNKSDNYIMQYRTPITLKTFEEIKSPLDSLLMSCGM